MKTKLMLLTLSISFFISVAQTEKNWDSRISNATIFLNKAQVTRVAKGRIDAGKSSIVFTGLTGQLDPQSIQVSGKGNFIVLGITHRQNFLNELNMPAGLKMLKDSVELMQRQITLEQSQKEILNKEEQMLQSNQKIGGANQNLSVAELKGMADFYRARLSEIVNARMKEDEKIKKLSERMVKLQRQIAEQNDLYNRNTSEIIVNVSAEAGTNADLEINYVVQNAGWYPVYDVRALNTKNPLQLSYKANVFQNTGEEWKNIKIKLSTANPNLGGQKPELYTWYLDFYQPVVQQYRRYKKSEAPAAMMKSADMSVAGEVQEEAPAAESVADYVSTVQTTLNTEFDVSLPYTITSSAKPVVVDIRNYEMKADYSYSVAPKLDLDAFLMAKATGWEEFNLLPGEANIFFEGTFIGKTFIDPNTIKDTLAVSLGRDKRIVVKREKVKDLTSRKVIGTNQKESYAYEISVRNTKQEAIKIEIEDHVPVTQNSQIEVTIVDLGGAKYNKDLGRLSWDLSLQPNETKKVTYKFEVKYPKDRQISGL